MKSVKVSRHTVRCERNEKGLIMKTTITVSVLILFLVGGTFSLDYVNTKIVSVLSGDAGRYPDFAAKVYFEDNGSIKNCKIDDDGRENLHVSVALTFMTTTQPVKLGCVNGYIEFIRGALPSDNE